MNKLVIQRTATYSYRIVLFVVCLSGAVVANAKSADPLPSWNDSPAKTAIVKFVKDAVKKGGTHYIPPAERIAVFDNDGTLWSEQPFICSAGLCALPG